MEQTRITTIHAFHGLYQVSTSQVVPTYSIRRCGGLCRVWCCSAPVRVLCVSPRSRPAPPCVFEQYCEGVSSTRHRHDRSPDRTVFGGQAR